MHLTAEDTRVMRRADFGSDDEMALVNVRVKFSRKMGGRELNPSTMWRIDGYR